MPNLELKSNSKKGVLSNKALAKLILLERKVRSAEDKATLTFRIVNKTKTLFPYKQSILWSCAQDKVLAISGSPLLDQNSSYLQWLNELFKQTLHENQIKEVKAEYFKGEVKEKWQKWLPTYGLIVPLICYEKKKVGILFYASDKEWNNDDIKMMDYLADSYAYSLDKHQIKNKTLLKQFFSSMLESAKKSIISIVIIFIVLFFPISTTVLAPAEVVPLSPTLIRSAAEGVVDKIHISPNETVKKGDLLVSLDERNIRSEINIAEKTLSIAKIELRQALQASLSDSANSVRVGILRAALDAEEARVLYYKDILERMKLYATHNGIAIYEDVNKWIGKPVEIGETIITLAKPTQVLLEIELPARDYITLKKDAEIKFFSNVNPSKPLSAKLDYISYKAHVTPNGVLAYTTKAKFDSFIEQKMRIGLRGTAKIYGEKAPIIYYLLRKPLAALRQLIGI